MSEQTDAQCVHAIAGGSRDAVARLYDRYADRLMAMGVKLLGDRSEAEDAVHDVFVEAWKRAGEYDPARGSVMTWLALRMRSRCLDRLRSSRVRQVRPAGLDLERMVPGSDDATAQALESRPALVRVLDCLPEAQREVVVLGYVHGLSCAEIATRLGAPVGTVKSRLKRALERARVLMAEYRELAG